MTLPDKEARKQEALQEKADRLYKFIYAYYMEWAVAPSWKQMSEGIGVSSKTITKLLELLRDQGRCLYRPKRWRQVFPREDD